MARINKLSKAIAIILSGVMLFTGCAQRNDSSSIGTNDVQASNTISTDTLADLGEFEIDLNEFDDLSDPIFLQYIEDNIYAELSSAFNSDDYYIENVAAIYISQEYIDEVAFNSQSNIYFGHTIAELNNLFDGTKYVFTLGDDGKTDVQEMQIIEDSTTQKIIRNVAIGVGVIMICVTVSCLTSGTGTPTAVNLIFTAAAENAKSFAVSSAIISGAAAGITRGIETGDISEALEATAMSGSEGFMWGAITGALLGGSSQALSIFKSTRASVSPRESELYVLNNTENAIEQVSYFGGKIVSSATQGCTRPDVIVQLPNGAVKAIEVKNYELASSNNRSHLLQVLKKQIAERVDNLPLGSSQEIVLDVRGRGYSTKLLDEVKSYLSDGLYNIYPNIPIEIIRY